MPDLDRLRRAIEAAEETAYGRDNDELSSDRARAIDAYMGRPYGNEVEGRSKIVSRDVQDTIEWIKPSLLRIFTGGDEVCRFDPVGPEDEEAAAQETDYVNHLVTQKNNWYALCYEWFTDALLTKNAYCLAYWEERANPEVERYRSLTEEQFALLMQDEEAQVLAHSEREEQLPDGQTAAYHDLELRRTRTYGCVKLQVIPPERVLVSERCQSVSVRECDFFEYWELKSIADLRAIGFEVPDDISDDAGGADTLEDNARDQFGENFDRRYESSTAEPLTRRVRVRMCWVRHDYDEDGYAELRQCVLVGNTFLTKTEDKAPAIDEVSGVPVACIVPTPLPHRHPGQSIADMTEDLQLIKTSIQRQMLDNLYLQNNGRYGVSDKVNLDDMLTSRPGGIVRVSEGQLPGQHIMPFEHPFTGSAALQMLEYVDQIRENRTGTNRYFTGVDQNALNRTASGIAQLTSSAAQRVEMVARTFAETGVKELFQIVHELTAKNATAVDVVKLRGKWVEVDPQRWRTRTDLKLAVGLGTGNKETISAGLMNILTAQREAFQIGVAGPKQIYNALTELTKSYGFASPEKFWIDPEQSPQQGAPPPDPAALAEQQKAQAKQAEAEQELQVGRAKAEQELQITQARANQEMEIKRQMATVDAELEIAKAQQSAQIEANREQSRSAMIAREADFKLGIRRMEQEGKLIASAPGSFDPLHETVERIESAQAQLAGAIAQLAEIVSCERETVVVRDNRGKVTGGRSRLVRPSMQ